MFPLVIVGSLHMLSATTCEGLFSRWAVDPLDSGIIGQYK